MPVRGTLCHSFGGSRDFPALMSGDISPSRSYDRVEIVRLLQDNPDELLRALNSMSTDQRASWEDFLIDEDVNEFAYILLSPRVAYTLTEQNQIHFLELALKSSISPFDVPLPAFSSQVTRYEEQVSAYTELLANEYKKGTFEKGLIEKDFTKDWNNEDWIVLAYIDISLSPFEKRHLSRFIDLCIPIQPHHRSLLALESVYSQSISADEYLHNGCCTALSIKSHLMGHRATLNSHTRILQAKHILSVQYFNNYLKRQDSDFFFRNINFCGFEKKIADNLGLSKTSSKHFDSIEPHKEYILGIEVKDEFEHAIYVNTASNTFLDANFVDETGVMVTHSFPSTKELADGMKLYLASAYPKCVYSTLSLEELAPNESFENKAFHALKENDVLFFKENREQLIRESLRYAQSEIFQLAKEKLLLTRSEKVQEIVSLFIICGYDITHHRTELETIFDPRDLRVSEKIGKETQAHYLEEMIHAVPERIQTLILERCSKGLLRDGLPVQKLSLLQSPKRTYYLIQSLVYTHRILQRLEQNGSYEIIVARLLKRNVIKKTEDIYFLSKHTLQTEVTVLARSIQMYAKLLSDVDDKTEWFKFISFHACLDSTRITSLDDILVNTYDPTPHLTEAYRNYQGSRSDTSIRSICMHLIRQYDFDLNSLLLDVGLSKDTWEYSSDTRREVVLHTIESLLYGVERE